MGDVLSLDRYSEDRAFRHGVPTENRGVFSRKELASCFLGARRDRMDVLWLKENAEFLNVLRSAGKIRPVERDGFFGYLPFYEGCLRHFDFFKPYYRFILSICMDLEDLGICDGELSDALVGRVHRSGILQHELSDLQRAETRRLLARRGCVLRGLDGLDDRLRAFMQSPVAFAVPNRRTAYELTHIVFYLSDYGQQDPKLESEAIQSIEYVGIMAFLDQDADLLSEVCLALRYAGQDVPQVWLAWLQKQRAACQISAQPLEINEVDDYHTFLVMEWAISEVVKHPVFESSCMNTRRFICTGRNSVLRGMTMALYAMDAEGLRMRRGADHELKSRLNAQEQGLWDRASGAVGCFDQFLCDFLARGYTDTSLQQGGVR